MNTNSRSIYLNTIFNGESKNKVLIAKAPAVCYEIIELFDTGPPRPTGIKFCDTSGNVGNLSTGSPNYPQHGGNRGGSSTSSTDNYKITANLTGKAKCVYDKIEKGNSTINNFLKKFDGDFPVSHLTYELNSNLPSNTNAVTLLPSNYMITIQLNSNNITNRATLMVARTIIHETIHAEMFRKLLSIANNGGNLNGLTKTQLNSMLSNGDFPGIYKYYTKYGTKFQHQQMANHYINVIADALADFDNNQHSYQFYKDISWVGLQSTDGWNNLSSSEKARINNIIKNFNNNGSKTCK